jgi:diguanylate cyclase (GGDEF)-like protein
MFRVLTCLAYDHNYWYVLVAAIVCIAGSMMTVRLFDRARQLTGFSRLVWVLLSGMAGGTAIWTTHFVAMLGFNPPTGYAYEPIVTLASLGFAMAFTALGLYLAAAWAGTAWVDVGGAVIGAGISVMHYSGMAGLEVAGHIEWQTDLVVASLILGAVFAILAVNRSARAAGPKDQALAAGLLVLAICSMHFTAMGAATFIPAPAAAISPQVFTSELMAISLVAILSAVAGLGLYVIDARSRRDVLDGFRHAALHDALTGMPNRAHLAWHLPSVLDASATAGRKVAVIVMDLDRFKDVNDVHGHRAGDALLQALAARLNTTVRSGEFVARVGGDEFVAVKQGIGEAGDALDFALRLAGCIAAPVAQHDRALTVGASLGVSLYPADAGEAEELISVADLAMYRAKKQAGNKICFYDQSMDEGRRTKSELAMELRDAIGRGELMLYYQPQIGVKTGEVIGLEALLRWNHPRRGLILPSEFIPIAEETGSILPIGEWVLRTACAEAACWRKPLNLSVNIAAAQLAQCDLPRIVHETLIETGLEPARLELEITEASIIDDLDGTLQVMRQLKLLGVAIAMDDYGTGYASLSTLQKFPFDKIKIDRSFVEGVGVDKASTAIVKATILLASNLDIRVLAEGVERQEHFDFLRDEGCAEVQGFLFGGPQHATEIAGYTGGDGTVPNPLMVDPFDGAALRAIA